MKGKTVYKNFKEEIDSLSISMSKFLINYYGIYNDSSKDFKLSHKEIKELIPSLKGVSFDWLMDNRKKLYIGEVVIVKDFYGNVAPYICPNLEESLTPQTINCKNSRLENEIDTLISKENLKPYQLSILCNKLKQCKRFKEYRIIRRILKKKLKEKNKVLKKYRIAKQDLLERERKNEY